MRNGRVLHDYSSQGSQTQSSPVFRVVWVSLKGRHALPATHLDLPRRRQVSETILRVHGHRFKCLCSICANLVIQNGVDQDVDAVGLRYLNGMHELVFGTPSSGNNALLVEFT